MNGPRPIIKLKLKPNSPLNLLLWRIEMCVAQLSDDPKYISLSDSCDLLKQNSRKKTARKSQEVFVTQLLIFNAIPWFHSMPR